MLTPNLPPFFDFFGNGLGMVGLELPKSLKTRFCPLGHFVTDFGHGAGNGTGGTPTLIGATISVLGFDLIYAFWRAH